MDINLKYKVNKFALVILVLILFLVLSTSCSRNIRESPGSLIIKTSLSSEMEVEKLVFEISDSDNLKIKEVFYDGEGDYSVEFNDLAPGLWQAKVTAYLADGSIFGEVNKDVEVIGGETVLVEMDLLAKINGSIEIEHNLPFSILENQSDYEYEVESSSIALSQFNEFEEAESNELIIRFKDGVQNERMDEILNELRFVQTNKIKRLNMYVVDVSEMKLDKAIDLIESYSEVKHASRNRKVHALSNLKIPDDPEYNKQWGYPVIRMPQVWNQIMESGGKSIRVAVIDSGIYYLHEDLADHVNVDAGYNFLSEDDPADFMDRYGHGTHVAGTIGAINNEIGVSGILQNVELIPVKVLRDSDGLGTFDKIIEGMYYAAGLHDEEDNPYPADILNLSLGGSLNPENEDEKKTIENIQDAVNDIIKEGIIIVAAAGNNKMMYPAKIDEVIAVGSASLDSNNYPISSSFSISSPELDFIAPGFEIYSTKPGDAYGFDSGTSMAAPHVSGVIGLMLSQGINSGDVRGILRETAMNLGDDDFNNKHGYGLINAYWALNQVSNISVSLNKKIEGNFEVIESKQIPLNSDGFSFGKLFSGEYRIDLLIDVQGTGEADPGDYTSSKEIVLEVGENKNLDFVLQEIGD